MKPSTAVLAVLLGTAAIVPAQAAPFFVILSSYDEASDNGGSLMAFENLSGATLHNVFLTDPSPLAALFPADPTYAANNMYPFGNFYYGNTGPGLKDLAPNSTVESFVPSASEDSGYYNDQNAALTVSLDYNGHHYSVSFSPNNNDSGGFVPIYGDPDFSPFIQVAHLDPFVGRNAIPEPASMMILGMGATGLGLVRRRR